MFTPYSWRHLVYVPILASRPALYIGIITHCALALLPIPPTDRRRAGAVGELPPVPTGKRQPTHSGGMHRNYRPWAEFQTARKSRTNRVSAASPSAQSSSVIDLSGLWLTPPLQRTNSMPAGQSAPIDHRIVPGPGRQEAGPDADRFDRLLQAADDARVAGEGVGVMRPGHRDLDPAPRRRSRRCRVSRSARRRGPAGVVGRAKVDRELDVAGDDVGRVGPDVEAADRRHQVAPRRARAPRS